VGIYVIKPNGTGQRRIYKPPFDDASLATAWSPSGTRIAYVAPGGLWTMSAAGKNRKRLTKGIGDTLSPTWSPNGKQIAFVDLVKPHGRKYALYVMGSSGGTPRRIVKGAYDPAWSPSGRVIAFDYGGVLWTVRPDGTGRKRIGPGRSPAWALDGSRLAFDRKGDLWTMRPSGTGAREVISVPGATVGIAWSPDGHWIAYGLGDRGDIMLVHPDGSGSRPLTHDPGLFHSEPSWQQKP